MDIKTTKNAIKVSWLLGRTPHLIGLHGLGKSSIVKQLCDEMGLEMVDVRLGQMADAGDIIGLPEFHTDANGKFTKYVLPDFFPRKEGVVIFLDEINRASKDLLQAVFELIYDNAIKGVKLPKNCYVIAASNPATDDYAVLDFSDSAFQDRFIHMKFQPTTEEFQSYMRKKFPTSAFLDFLQEDEKCLEDGGLQDFSLNFVKPSRRSWEAAFKLEQMYDNGEIDNDLFTEMTMGIVGLHATPAAMTFKKTHVGSIKPVDALENYDKVRNNVLKSRDKGRTDILGNLINGIGEEIGKRKGLELTEANNLIRLVADLTPEQAYTLCTLFTTGTNHDVCQNVPGMDGGLLENDELIEILTKTKALREQAALDIEEAKAPKAKKSKKV